MARLGTALVLRCLLLVLPVALSCSDDYVEAVDQICSSRFSSQMEELEQSQWCSWDQTLELYSELTNCSFVLALKLHCFWPNADVDRLFVDVHRKYFEDCALIGRALRDPPTEVSGPFILGPVVGTLLMTALVVWRGKRNEGIV